MSKECDKPRDQGQGEALRELEDQLTCVICFQLYTEPKVLACHHVFCRGCLARLVVRNERQDLEVHCSTCRQPTPVPQNGIAGLQSAFHINQLFEVRKKLQANSDTKTEQASSIAATTVGDICTRHRNEEKKLFCKTCRELICSHCVFRGEKHHSHEYALIPQVCDEVKAQIELHLEPLESQNSLVKGALQNLDAYVEELYENQGAVETRMRKAVKQLHDEVVTECTRQLYKLTQERVEELAPYRDQLETSHSQIGQCVELLRGKIENENPVGLIKMKNVLIKKAKDLGDEFRIESLLHNKTGFVKVYLDVDRIASTIKDSMNVYFSDVCSAKSQASGAGLHSATVSLEANAQLELRTAQGGPSSSCEDGEIKCELVSEITGAITEVNHRKLKQGLYAISYQPTIKGVHSLHIKIDGQHIHNSPFRIPVQDPSSDFSIPLRSYKCAYPGGVAVNSDGRIVVTNLKEQCVNIISPFDDAVIKKSIALPNLVSMKTPFLSGIVFTEKGNFLIVDEANNSVYGCDGSGTVTKAVGIGNRPEEAFHLSNPTDIALNPENGNAYIADSSNHRIVVLDSSNLTLLFTFGRKGNDKGSFHEPSGVACNDNGKVYVADRENHRVQVFQSGGSFLSKFGKRGRGRGALCRPVGIAVDCNNKVVYVSDSHFIVSLFSPEGQFLLCVGGAGDSLGLMDRPRRLAVDECGVLYVCSYMNNSLLLF